MRSSDGIRVPACPKVGQAPTAAERRVASVDEFLLALSRNWEDVLRRQGMRHDWEKVRPFMLRGWRCKACGLNVEGWFHDARRYFPSACPGPPDAVPADEPQGDEREVTPCR